MNLKEKITLQIACGLAQLTEQRQKLEKLQEFVNEVIWPDVEVTVDLFGGCLDFNRCSREQFDLIRRALGQQKWDRDYTYDSDTLIYSATIADNKIRFWATEPPPTCKVVREWVDVPAQRVLKTRIDCGNNKDSS